MCILISSRCWKVHYPGGRLFSNCYDVGNAVIIYIPMFYWSSTIKTHKILHRTFLLNWIIKGAPVLSATEYHFFSRLDKQTLQAISCTLLAFYLSSIASIKLTFRRIHDTSHPVFASHWESCAVSEPCAPRPSASSRLLCRRIFWLENNHGEMAADQHQIGDRQTCRFVCAVEDLLLLFVYWERRVEIRTKSGWDLEVCHLKSVERHWTARLTLAGDSRGFQYTARALWESSSMCPTSPRLFLVSTSMILCFTCKKRFQWDWWCLS